MAFSYDQLEDNLVEYLTPLLSNVDVAAMPEREDGWHDVKDKPIVYVFYSESAFNPSISNDFVKQEEKPIITCNVRTNKRRGSGGINEVAGLLKKYLQGYQIAGTGCERLQLESIKFEERDKDKQTWSYNVSFSTKKMQMQFIDDSEVPGPNLREVIFNDQVQL